MGFLHTRSFLNFKRFINGNLSLWYHVHVSDVARRVHEKEKRRFTEIQSTLLDPYFTADFALSRKKKCSYQHAPGADELPRLLLTVGQASLSTTIFFALRKELCLTFIRYPSYFLSDSFSFPIDWGTAAHSFDYTLRVCSISGIFFFILFFFVFPFSFSSFFTVSLLVFSDDKLSCSIYYQTFVFCLWFSTLFCRI